MDSFFRKRLPGTLPQEPSPASVPSSSQPTSTAEAVDGDSADGSTGHADLAEKLAALVKAVREVEARQDYAPVDSSNMVIAAKSV